MYFRPVIVTDVVDKWPAMNWSKDFFIQNYGKEKVMVKLIVVSYLPFHSFINSSSEVMLQIL